MLVCVSILLYVSMCQYVSEVCDDVSDVYVAALAMCMQLHGGAYDAAQGVLVWGVYKLLMGHAGAADDARRSS